MIVLIGFMGSGKTTVARMLAARVGLPYVDTDRVVETDSARSIPELFATEGEAGFRALERAAVHETLSGPDAIVSLGGGAVLDPDTRRLLERHTVVLLEVALDTALERARSDAGDRPLLTESDPSAIYAARLGIYRGLAGLAVPTDDRSPHEVVDEIVKSLDLGMGTDGPRVIRVATPSDPYDVIVGRGVAGEIHRHVALPRDAEKAFLITHPSLESYATTVVDALRAAGLEVKVVRIAEGEAAKSLDSASALYEQLADGRAHRDDVVVSFGGGVVSDVGGFVASTYMRGLAHVAIPTTLLGQVDAAIGGKTGVNLGDAKNQIGTIYQPRAVLCDVDLLRTCPAEETRSGLAEVVKYGFIADPGILDELDARRSEIVALDPDALVALVARSVAVKASIVASDERERGDRAFLNYGHTFAHAVETVLGLGAIRHGEAVALGMMAAAYTAESLGWIDRSLVERHREALSIVGLPTHARLDFDRLNEAWSTDKKYKRGVRLVLLRGLGRPRAGVEVARDVLEAAIARLARED